MLLDTLRRQHKDYVGLLLTTTDLDTCYRAPRSIPEDYPNNGTHSPAPSMNKVLSAKSDIQTGIRMLVAGASTPTSPKQGSARIPQRHRSPEK